MAQSICCPNCGKTYPMKPELLGKQVRCGQCKKSFVAATAKPAEDPDEPIVAKAVVVDAEPAEEEPIQATIAPVLRPPTPTRPSSPRRNVGAGPTGDVFSQSAATLAADAASAEPVAFGPVVSRRAAKGGFDFLEHLSERKRSAAVAVVALVLLFVFLVLFFRGSVPIGFSIVPIIGMAIAPLGLLLPVVEPRRHRGSWVNESASRLAGFFGAMGLILVVVYGIMALANIAGAPIPAALGMSVDATLMMVSFIIGGIVIFFGAAVLVVLVSWAWNLACVYGFVRVADMAYLGMSPVLLMVLCVLGLSHGPMRMPDFATNDLPREPMHQPPVVPPVFPQLPVPGGGTNHSSSIPGPGNFDRFPSHRGIPSRDGQFGMTPSMANPNDPEFYRANLTALSSPNLNERRVAAKILARAEPKQLQKEIARALEALLLGDRDPFVRTDSLKALVVWNAEKIVPIAIQALSDSSIQVRTCAIDILRTRKDPRAIEPLIAALSDPSNNSAIQCLTSMGPGVEDAVLKHYDTASERAKLAMIEILRNVATEKGVAKLRAIAENKNESLCAGLAQHALLMRGDGFSGGSRRSPRLGPRGPSRVPSPPRSPEPPASPDDGPAIPDPPLIADPPPYPGL